MEQIDIFDETFQPLPNSPVTIDEVHQKGLWHQTFACWLVNKETGTVYLQLRGPKNRVGANTFDATASGHLAAGETPQDGFRELREEVGDIPYDTPVYWGVNRSFFQKENYINREFCHVFIVPTAATLADFTPEAGEVSGLFACSVTDALDLFLNKREAITLTGLNETRAVSARDFCCYEDRVQTTGYYLKIMQAITGLLQG